MRHIWIEFTVWLYQKFHQFLQLDKLEERVKLVTDQLDTAEGISYQRWLHSEELKARVKTAEDTIHENAIEAQDAFKQMFARLEELEKSYATGYIKQGTPKEPDSPVVPGFVPWSKRKAQWERDHQKNTLNPTAQQIVRNNEAMKGK